MNNVKWCLFQTFHVLWPSSSVIQNAFLSQSFIQPKPTRVTYYCVLFLHINYQARKSNVVPYCLRYTMVCLAPTNFICNYLESSTFFGKKDVSYEMCFLVFCKKLYLKLFCIQERFSEILSHIYLCLYTKSSIFNSYFKPASIFSSY